MKTQRGAALIIAILVAALALTLGAALTKHLISDLGLTSSRFLESKAFYLAEAGIERGKREVVRDSNWYTDLPHAPADDIIWLMRDSGGHRPPEGETLGDDRFKVVKEKGKNIIYSVGYLGSDIFKSRARCLIKVEYSHPPFRQISWKLL